MTRIIALAVVIFLVAIPAVAQKVYVDYDREADFDSYETFAWSPTVEISLAETSPTMHAFIKNAIEYRLSQGEIFENTEDPDLSVTYYGSASSVIQIQTVTFGYSYGPSWYWDPFWGGAHVTGGAGVYTYDQGTLVIDIWDAETKHVVWRGSMTGLVPETPEKSAKKIDKGIVKMIKKFDKMYAKENQ